MNYSFCDTHHTLMGKDNEEILMSKLTNVLIVFYDSNPVKLNKVYINSITFSNSFLSYSFYSISVMSPTPITSSNSCISMSFPHDSNTIRSVRLPRTYRPRTVNYKSYWRS